MKNRGEGQGEGVGEGLNREGGLINFPPLKRSWRDLFEGGGLNREFTVFYVGNSKLSSD